ncbi:MAG: helix-turn-helix transcriptional regulator, partial [Pseudomonas sp.]
MQTMSLSTASKNVAPVPVTEQLSLTEYDQLVSILQEGAFDNEALTRALEALRVYFRANYVTLILKVVGIEELGLMLVAG